MVRAIEIIDSMQLVSVRGEAPVDAEPRHGEHLLESPSRSEAAALGQG